MGEAIEERGGQLLVAGKDRDPLGKREVRPHDGGAALVAIGDEVKQQFSADAIKRDEADFVDLCGAPNKLTNGETSVMWSRKPDGPQRPTISLSSHHITPA